MRLWTLKFVHIYIHFDRREPPPGREGSSCRFSFIGKPSQRKLPGVCVSIMPGNDSGNAYKTVVLR